MQHWAEMCHLDLNVTYKIHFPFFLKNKQPDFTDYLNHDDVVKVLFPLRLQ